MPFESAISLLFKEDSEMREYPGGLLVSIPGFHCHGPRFISGQRTEVPKAAWHRQKKKKGVRLTYKKADQSISCKSDNLEAN